MVRLFWGHAEVSTQSSAQSLSWEACQEWISLQNHHEWLHEQFCKLPRAQNGDQVIETFLTQDTECLKLIYLPQEVIAFFLNHIHRIYSGHLPITL